MSTARSPAAAELPSIDAMTAKPSDNDPKDAGARDDRKQRLAAALRENLKRRKAQARGRADAQPDDSPAAGSEESSDEA